MRSLAARLRSFAPFAGLSDTECTTLHGLLESLRVPPGATVVARGAPAGALYFIERGEAQVRGSGRPATLGSGDWFGEIALLTGGAHTADVVASTPLRLLRLSAEAYRRHLHPLPDVQRRAHQGGAAARRGTARGGMRLAASTAEGAAALQSAPAPASATPASAGPTGSPSASCPAACG